MKNNALLSAEKALGSEQILKMTALLYLKEALINQEYETCRELIDTAKNLGVEGSAISTAIKEYLDGTSPGGQKGNRLR